MRHTASLAIAALLVAAPVAGQTVWEIEAGGGYSVVDVGGVAEADGAFANDWSQSGYRLSGRALFNDRFGAEVGYQYLYWYRVRIPFGSQPINREYDVTALSAMALMRFGGEGAVVDLGAGFAMLDDPVGQLSVAVGWEIMDRLAIKLRADGLLASQPTLPVGLAFSYAIRPGSD